VLGIILFADWCRDQYEKTTPEIVPKDNAAASHSPPAFIVRNVSPYFWMTNVQLICGIDSAAFDVGASGPVGFSIPVTSGKLNPPIRPHKSVEYRCDPSDYLKFENGKIWLLGMTSVAPLDGATASQARLIQAEIWIGVKYRIFWLSNEREFVSPMWKYHSASAAWEEIRPTYK
jgi:hypothetical protein